MLISSLSLNNSLLVIIMEMTMAMLILSLQKLDATTFTLSQIALPNCHEKCGDVTVPYPFGIGNNCHYTDKLVGHNYNLTCDHTANPPRLIYGSNIEVVNITLDGELRVLNSVAYDCYKNGLYQNSTHNSTNWIAIERFIISTTQNSLVAIGCDTFVWFDGSGPGKQNKTQFHSGCMTMCNNEQTAVLGDSGTCSGVGCCKASIPNGVTNISITARSFNNHKDVQDFNPCSIAFVVANDAMPPSLGQLLSQDWTYLATKKYPMVYNWSIGTKDCNSKRAAGKKEDICMGNSTCLDLPTGWGYRCQCIPGFQGNPYLHDCQDIDECAKEHTNLCRAPARCVNTIGSYNCTCPKGYSRGNGTKDHPCIADDDGKVDGVPIKVKIIGGVCGGIILLFIVAFLIHWQQGDRKLRKMRETFFDKNGGHILRQKLSGRDVSMGHTVKMFSVEELEKATENYSESNIIGRGGFGMVYKGTLKNKATLPNTQIVAIKRSLKVSSSQVEQFINEIVALSQVNNKNVVKLLGCCLETEVPLLVYEYISNGTLYDHLHDERKASLLTWDVRLRIATEISEVLAYLHNTICIPIIHRDIKSANILLDASYTAKVSDFGASKLAPSDQEQAVTMVQGTWGYLDPEYMQSGQLTEKSDVYSFGVVLVELLTRERAICYGKPENERSLAVYFLRNLKEDRLLEILDNKIARDEVTEQLKEVADLAKRCLQLKGEDRPTMKEVARELDRISKIGSHPWLNNKNIVLREEETEYLLGERETQVVINHSYGSNDTIDDPLSRQSRVVQIGACE